MSDSKPRKPTMTAEKARATKYREFLREIRNVEGENLRAFAPEEALESEPAAEVGD
jgi:hypothetical protein